MAPYMLELITAQVEPQDNNCNEDEANILHFNISANLNIYTHNTKMFCSAIAHFVVLSKYSSHNDTAQIKSTLSSLRGHLQVVVAVNPN